MNVFDIIGPVMVGPSSSHTAGAARLGKVARTLLGEPAASATIYLHGSFARTYRGHGTDRALIGGLLGFDPDDLRLRESLDIAHQVGLDYRFIPADLGEIHPNSALLDVCGVSNRRIRVLGSSIGGGKVLIRRVDDLDVEFTGEYYTLIIPHIDAPGVVATVTSVLASARINIAQMKVYRKERGGQALILIEVDQPVPAASRQQLERIAQIESVTVVEPI